MGFDFRGVDGLSLEETLIESLKKEGYIIFEPKQANKFRKIIAGINPSDSVATTELPKKKRKRRKKYKKRKPRTLKQEIAEAEKDDEEAEEMESEELRAKNSANYFEQKEKLDKLNREKVLDAIKSGACIPYQIAEKTGFGKSHVNRLLNILSTAGYIKFYGKGRVKAIDPQGNEIEEIEPMEEENQRD